VYIRPTPLLAHLQGLMRINLTEQECFLALSLTKACLKKTMGVRIWVNVLTCGAGAVGVRHDGGGRCVERRHGRRRALHPRRVPRATLVLALAWVDRGQERTATGHRQRAQVRHQTQSANIGKKLHYLMRQFWIIYFFSRLQKITN